MDNGEDKTPPKTTNSGLCTENKFNNSTLKPLHYKLMQIKPSLSMNSLPPPSPTEKSATLQNIMRNERPYNSLKKKRAGEKDKELWRRSWESQNSVQSLQSTTTSGKDTEFWAAYNYIMDTDLIDSCREFNGETCNTDDLCQPNDNVQNINNKANSEPSGSQRSSNEDPRRLRRWLTEMEKRFTKSPTFTEAMKLNSVELQKTLSEFEDLYREIVANGAFLRNLVKNNSLYTENVENDAKIPDIDTKRVENVVKALERRYHLLYLKSFEVQCMLESLIERRNLNSNNHEEISDEEPVAKIAKLGNEGNKMINNEAQPIDNDGSNGLQESFNETDEKDVKSITMDVPDNVNVDIDETDNILSPQMTTLPDSPENTITKRPKNKDFSKFHRSNRKSKNCAIFYFKHDDSEAKVEKNDNDEAFSSEATSEDEVWEYSHDATNVEAMKENELNNETMKPIQVRKLDFGIDDVQTQFDHDCKDVVKTKLISKESLLQLVIGAENLVRDDINSKTLYQSNYVKFMEMVSRKDQAPKNAGKFHKDNVKTTRVKEWLKQQSFHELSSALNPVQTTDCEASAECTTSTDSSDDSEEITDSITTCLHGEGLKQSRELFDNSDFMQTPNQPEKVKLRNNATARSVDRRPWSVSCMSQLTGCSQQNLTDMKCNQQSINQSNITNSISESALNTLTPQHCSTSSESSISNVCVQFAVKNDGRNSLKKRRNKLRKKSYASTTKKSESGSEKLLLKSMVKSKSFSMQATSLLELEDLSVTLSMISFDSEVPDLKVEVNKPESDEEPQKLVKPDFRLGSITTYGNNNLGPLAALSNYNLEKEHSSYSEQAWDSYQEKYNSEAYSETADADGARRLLDFGDDYRNFLDSQSDNCSSAANIDSMSPPRNRKNFNLASPTSTIDSSLEIKSEERLPSNSEVRRRSLHSSKSQIREPSSSSSSDYSSDIEYDNKIMKILTESKINLEKTEALRGASEQHLKPDDYDAIVATCEKNTECLKAVLRGRLAVIDVKSLNQLIAEWERLLSWSENAAKARHLQEEIHLQKKFLTNFGKQYQCNDTKESIVDEIDELMNDRKQLQNFRSNMLKLNASVHSWLTKQEMQRNTHDDLMTSSSQTMYEKSIQSDPVDEELYLHLKDEIHELYSNWDVVDDQIKSRLEILNSSLDCWKQFENGMQDFCQNLKKDRGALNGLQGAIETGDHEDIVDNVQRVAKLISTNKDITPEAALRFISSNSGSISDSGFSDSGVSQLSEREKRLCTLKKIAKQLEDVLSPSSEVLKNISSRMIIAENELKVLQNTCKDLILKTSEQLLQQKGFDLNSHSRINVQIPIIHLKKMSKKSPPRRRKRQNSQVARTPSITTIDCQLKLKDLKLKRDGDDDEKDKKSWWKRIVQIAVPFQLTLIVIFCAACLLEPRCCDVLNSYSNSFSPQLRYVKGPPPI